VIRYNSDSPYSYILTDFITYKDCQLQREEAVKIISGWMGLCLKVYIEHELVKTGVE
jgi:hypothetical protein